MEDPSPLQRLRALLDDLEVVADPSNAVAQRAALARWCTRLHDCDATGALAETMLVLLSIADPDTIERDGAEALSLRAATIEALLAAIIADTESLDELQGRAA